MKVVALTLTALLTTSSLALAQSNDPPQPAPHAAGGPNIVAPYAQAIAHISTGGTVLGAKGFTSVTNPSAGIYCLELAGGPHPSRRPVVSVDWSNSSGSGLWAYWRPSNNGCPSATARTIEIDTYSLVGGVPTQGNTVAFVVMVP